MPANIPVHYLTDGAAYWVLFWSVVNILLPPREVFANCSPSTQRRYNTILMLISYYGSLNLRQMTVKLYSAVQTAPVSADEAHGISKGIDAAKEAIEEISKPPIKEDQPKG